MIYIPYPALWCVSALANKERERGIIGLLFRIGAGLVGFDMHNTNKKPKVSYSLVALATTYGP